MFKWVENYSYLEIGLLIFKDSIIQDHYKAFNQCLEKTLYKPLPI